jgi:hypothetical protein
VTHHFDRPVAMKTMPEAEFHLSRSHNTLKPAHSMSEHCTNTCPTSHSPHFGSSTTLVMLSALYRHIEDTGLWGLGTLLQLQPGKANQQQLFLFVSLS